MYDAKVEQFLVIAKTVKESSALAGLLARAISEPGLFVFGELISLPNVQQLRNTDAGTTLSTVELFAYGTWLDYRGQPASFLPLDERQAKKLKQLSVCSFAQTRKTLHYAELIESLELGSVRELEDFIINDCLYPGLLKCKLDQRLGCVHVEDVSPRDVRPEQLPVLATQLGKWLENIGGVMAAMKHNVELQQSAHIASSALKEAHAKELERVSATVEKIQASTMKANENAAPDDFMMMDDAYMDAGPTPPRVGRIPRAHHGARGGFHGPEAKRRR